MTEAELADQVSAEIVALHNEFERWFRGESDDPTRMLASIPADFTFISPGSEVVPTDVLVAGLLASHGSRQIRIRIDNPIVRWSEGSAVLATYEEWHDHADYTTARQTTVLFTIDAAAPGGLRWRHVHETWIQPPPQ
ncbi:MAG: hypothetical protein GY720_03475 [bacterium]|nr:hypothetical protein [bacterium]